MSNLVILKCDTNAKFEKNGPFSLFEIAIFNIFFNFAKVLQDRHFAVGGAKTFILF